MTIADVFLVYEGYEHNLRFQMTLNRELCYWTAAYGNRDPKKPFPKSPSKWQPFPWEKEKPKQRLSAREYLNEFNKKHNGSTSP